MARAKSTPVLTDMQKRYEAETGSTMFSSPKNRNNGRGSGSKSKNKEAYGEWAKTTAGMDAGKNRFNAMMANRSQNPVLGQTQSGMSGFDKFQAMQAARNSAGSTYNQNPGMEALSNALAAKGDPRSVFSNSVENYRNRNSGQPAGYDKFQAMQAARDDIQNTPKAYQQGGGLPGLFQGIARRIDEGQGQQAGYDRFQAQMGANPLILQQLQQQMGQRQIGPQFNAFGFGAQPGLAAQGGQGGSMLANMSSQGMNQLAAGQQNNPTIFKAKS